MNKSMKYDPLKNYLKEENVRKYQWIRVCIQKQYRLWVFLIYYVSVQVIIYIYLCRFKYD